MMTTKLSRVLLAALLLTACQASVVTDGGDGLSGPVLVDGSSTVFPITEAVAEEFKPVHPDVQVTVGLSGTGGGFKKFCRGEIDINDASRPIKESEIELCKEAKIEYVSLSVAYDGLAVLVHPENTWVDHLTVAELKKIWEPAAQNTVMKWNQIRPEWPDKEIHLFGPGVASGTFDYFTEAIMGKAGESRGDFTASEDDNVLVQGVATDTNALGFFGLAYYEENKDKLKIVPVDGGKGPVSPNLETVKNGTYAPLSRPLFIYFSNISLQKPQVAAFGKFYIANAAALSADAGYIPLTESEYATQVLALDSALEALPADAE